MIGVKKVFLIAWPVMACCLASTLAFAGSAAAETIREMESARGTVRIIVLPLEAPAPPTADGLPSLPPEDGTAIEAGKDSLNPVEAITDFTSLSEMARGAEAVLQVSYFDKASREELKFPLKYSELRRYLRKHPLEYQEGSLADRNVALMGDLAWALRIRMLPPGETKAKP